MKLFSLQINKPDGKLVTSFIGFKLELNMAASINITTTKVKTAFCKYNNNNVISSQGCSLY